MTHVQKIRELLLRKKVSMTEVAKRAGVPQQTADELSKSLTKSIRYALAIARALDVPMDWLFDDKQSWEDLARAKQPLGIDRKDIILADRVWQQFVTWALRDPEPRDFRKTIMDRLAETFGEDESRAEQESGLPAGGRKGRGKGKAG